MSNADINRKLLEATDARARSEILEAIATHYGITPDEALEEVTAADAEHLLDYMTGPARAATSVLMQRHGLGGAK